MSKGSSIARISDVLYHTAGGASSDMQFQSALGTMVVHDDVIAATAAWAALDTHGIVGLGAHGVSAGWADLLRGDHGPRGVKVQDQNGLKIEMFLVVAFGSNIPQLAQTVAANVSRVMVDLLQVEPERVTVHVTGIKRLASRHF